MVVFGDVQMKNLKTIAILFVAMLLPMVSAVQALTVTIDEPTISSTHLQNDVLLRAHMDENGTLKYKLDGNSEVVVCNTCSSFQNTLLDLSNGQHTIKVTGVAGNNTDDATVNFTVNQTGTTTTVPKENETGEPRFATGFNKLPQQFLAGEITEAQLKSILENNKLNPGIINRLAKTGKLTPSLIDTITETQFLPTGIAGKLLGILGFGKNNAFESLIKNYNLTDAQLVALFKHSQLPSGTVKHLIKERSLSQSAINALLENQELKPGIIKQLVESQTLTPANVQQLIENQKLNKKIVYTLIQQQLLDNATIEKIKVYGNGDVEKQLEKFQQHEQKRVSKQENKEDEDSSDDDERGKSDSARGKKFSLGKQKGKED